MSIDDKSITMHMNTSAKKNNYIVTIAVLNIAGLVAGLRLPRSSHGIFSPFN